MNKIIPWEMNEQYKDKFIQGYWIDPDLCDRFVHHFHTDGDELLLRRPEPRNYWGRELYSFTHDNGRDVKLYIKYMYSCMYNYSQEFPISESKFINLRLKKHVNVQYYEPGECYEHWHFEKSQELNDLVIYRDFVFMTYLNDCDDGHTTFLYQNINIRPQKGLTIIWPGDWMHTHKGTPATKSKNIITGWFVGLPANMLRDTDDSLGYCHHFKSSSNDLSISY